MWLSEAWSEVAAIVRQRELRNVPVFRGPEDTIFYYDGSDGAWVITAYDGDEVLVPEGDLLQFLNHCLAYSDGPPVGGPTLE